MDVHVEDIEHFYNNPIPTRNANVNTGNQNKKKIEDIPENRFEVNVVKQKKNISFSQEPPLSVPMKQTIPKSHAKISRPIQPQPNNQITYDEILSKMGMYVVNGQLHLKGKNQPSIPVNKTEGIPQNSYIYNKYFKDAFNSEEEPQRPRTLLEYRDMLVRDIIQKAKIKQIKSKKLIMPNSNINVASGNGDLNKLFRFSQR